MSNVWQKTLRTTAKQNWRSESPSRVAEEVGNKTLKALAFKKRLKLRLRGLNNCLNRLGFCVKGGSYPTSSET
jgi:hypothetical protein